MKIKILVITFAIFTPMNHFPLTLKDKMLFC